MFDFKQLILITPFEQKTKDDLIAKADSLSELQKKEIENICWDLIAQEFQNKIILAKPPEMNTNTKESTADNSFNAVEENFFNELANKLSVANDSDKLAQLREKIQTSQPSA